MIRDALPARILNIHSKAGGVMKTLEVGPSERKEVTGDLTWKHMLGAWSRPLALSTFLSRCHKVSVFTAPV